MKKKLSKFFDHTLLKSEATRKDIERLCKEAIVYDFYSVCVNPLWVYTCKELLKNTDIKVTSVIGFPFGACATTVLQHEAMVAINDGADELDMVANPGLLLSHENSDIKKYETNIKTIKNVVDRYNKGTVLKVIIESELLTDDDIALACDVCKKYKVDFVKTSTGFANTSHKGASIHAVKLINQLSDKSYQVKASGGIKTLDDTILMIRAGADRIGSSSSVNIIEEYHKRLRK